MKKVLLVEDNEFILDIISQKCSGRYDLQYVMDGAEALEKIRTFHPDVVLLDLELPHISGLDILAAMRGDETLKDIAVIIFSNHADNPEFKSSVEQYNVSRIVQKALLSPDEVVEIIDEV